MVEKLKELKQRTNMTNQQIAEKSGIPESTVARIFSGKTPNPTILTVVSIVRAMGGTAEDMYAISVQLGFAGDPAPAEEPPASSAEKEDASGLSEAMYHQILSLYQSEIRKKDLWLKRMFWFLAGLILVIVAVLLIDLLCPTVGFFQGL